MPFNYHGSYQLFKWHYHEDIMDGYDDLVQEGKVT